jgi:hypothetical protein
MVGQSEYSFTPECRQKSAFPLSVQPRSTQTSLTLTQLRVLQHVESDKLLRVHALQTQNLNARAGETTLGSFGGTLHEQDDGCRGHSLVNGRPSLGGQETGMEDRGKSEGRGTDGVQR